MNIINIKNWLLMTRMSGDGERCDNSSSQTHDGYQWDYYSFGLLFTFFCKLVCLGS